MSDMIQTCTGQWRAGTVRLAQHISTSRGVRICLSAFLCSELRCCFYCSAPLTLLTGRYILTGIYTGLDDSSWVVQRGYEKNKTLIVRLVMICLAWLSVSSASDFVAVDCFYGNGWGLLPMRPHAPQRLRAAASINLLNLMCTLHGAYRAGS